MFGLADFRLAEVIKIMIALGVLLTYGLQLTVTADLAWQGLRSKLVKNCSGCEEQTADGDKEDLSPRLTAYYYGMRFSLILGTSECYKRSVYNIHINAMKTGKTTGVSTVVPLGAQRIRVSSCIGVIRVLYRAQ